MYDEDLAPDIQDLAQAKLKQARREKRKGRTPSAGQPAASAPGPLASLQNKNLAAEHGAENVDPDREKEGRLARALRARQAAGRRAKADMLGKAGITGASQGMLQKVRQIKNLIRVIRGGALVGTSLGDVFLSLTVLFLTLIGDWALERSQLVAGYKMFDPKDRYVLLDKMLWYGGWTVIAAVLVLAVVLAYFAIYLSQNPLEAVKFGIELL